MRSNRSSLCFVVAAAVVVCLAVAEEDSYSILDELPHKRFSMNYLDLVEPHNPRSWQNTITVPAAKQQKRFSMNYLDLVDPKDPVSWRNRMLSSEKKPEKRFSMNFLDTLGAGDPLSWENTMKNSGGAAANGGDRSSRLRRERSLSSGWQQNDFQSKRSAATLQAQLLSAGKAAAMADNIDSLLRYASEAFGPEACRQPIWNGLMRMRLSLAPLLPRGHQNFFPEDYFQC